MKKHTYWQTFLCLALVVCTVFVLCACPADGPAPAPGPDTPIGPNDPNNPDKPNPPEEDVVYGDGNIIEGAGDAIEDGAPVLSPVTYDESTAQEVAGSTLIRNPEEYFTANTVWRATGDSTPAISRTENKSYAGNGTILLFPNGLNIRSSKKLTFSNMVIVGDISITQSSSVIFENVEIKGSVKIDKDSSGVVFNACRLSGGTLIENKGAELTVMSSYMEFTATALLDSGSATTVQNCRLVGAGTAIISSATEITVRENTITLSNTEGTGIEFAEGASNALAALNRITGTQKSVTVTGARNAVVVRNSLISVEAVGNKNLYICDNEMGGRLTASDNNYFLGDNNTYPNDGYAHTAILSGNENHNGNTLMDVDKRLEYGADEALLPHVDKTLFVDMERKSTVKDVLSEDKLSLTAYIAKHAQVSDTVIVAPGVYSTNRAITFDASQSNTTLYAYGVYMERMAISGENSIGSLIVCRNTENITVKGLTVGYAQPSTLQGYVVATNPKKRTVDILPGAGMINAFGNTNATYYLNMTAYLHPAENDYKPIGDVAMESVKKQNDGTFRITFKESAVVDIIKTGDVLTNRYPSYSKTILTEYCANITYQDLTVYGIAGAFCCYEQENTSATTYYRMADTTRLGELITEDEYNKYKDFERTYKINLEIKYDRNNKLYFGSQPHISSIDGVQADRCAQGSQVISCLFENMCDDGSLQKGNSSRLVNIIPNGDGTVSIVFKGAHNGNQRLPLECATIKQGDRVVIYTAYGQLLCNSIALDNAVQTDRILSTYTKYIDRPADTGGNSGRPWLNVYTVTVSETDLAENWRDILADPQYDKDANGNLTDDEDSPLTTKIFDQKILVDNGSRSCNGFLFDNVIVRNNRSRGVLIKACDGTVTNCTFRDNAKIAIAVLYELYWGESGNVENLVIKNNLIDHVGFAITPSDLYLHYPINIAGLSKGTTDEQFLLFKDIQILHNKFINPVGEHWIYMKGVQNVQIEGNDFGSFKNENEDLYMKVALLNGAKDIILKDNILSAVLLEMIENAVEGEHYKGVIVDGMDDIIPDNI